MSELTAATAQACRTLKRTPSACVSRSASWTGSFLSLRHFSAERTFPRLIAQDNLGMLSLADRTPPVYLAVAAILAVSVALRADLRRRRLTPCGPPDCIS